VELRCIAAFFQNTLPGYSGKTLHLTPCDYHDILADIHQRLLKQSAGLRRFCGGLSHGSCLIYHIRALGKTAMVFVSIAAGRPSPD
jgi:hypothetical protein